MSPRLSVFPLTLAALIALGTLSACDGAAPQAEEAHSLTLAATAPATDLYFRSLSVRSGGTIRTMLEASASPEAPRLTLSSQRTSARKHRVSLEAEGLDIEQAELFVKRLEDGAFVSVRSAKNLSELSGGTVDRAPQSTHYEEAVDEDGDIVIIKVYDYQSTGATFQSDYTEGDTAVDHVGYRVQLKEHAPGLKQLRIDGYDEVAIASMRTLSASEVRARALEFFKTAESE